MSLKDKTKEVLDAGKAERGNFTPHGKPKELYDYWLANTESTKGMRIREGLQRENFCHYWRVVAIWAPLMKLTDMLGKRNVQIGALVILALGLLSLLAWGTTFPGVREVVVVVLVVSAFFGAIFGFFAGLEWLDKRTKYDIETLVATGMGILMGVAFLGFLVYFHIWAISTYGVLKGILFVWGIILGAAAGLAAMVGVMFGAERLISGVRAAARNRARQRSEENPDYVAPTQKVGGFLSAVADFIVLIVQVLRVNKWKICPLVDVDTPRSDNNTV